MISTANFTPLPNVIFHIGLTPIELSVYSHITHITSERGVCDVTMSILMKACKLNLTVLKKTTKLLALPREELGGKSLIIIDKRSGLYGDRITDLLLLTDLNTGKNHE